MQSRYECRSRGERRRGDVETRGRAELEEQSSEKCIAETRDQTRDESRESREPAETRIVSKQRCKARAKTRAMTAKCSSSCGALYYIEKAQMLPWCCKWRVISMSTPTGAERGVELAPLAPLTLAAYVRYCITRERVTTAPT